MKESKVVVSYCDGIRRVAVPYGSVVPSDWPEPWAAQDVENGQWWDNYDNPPNRKIRGKDGER